MRFSVLGCFGGNTLDMRPTSYLINGNIAIDAGALTSALPLREPSTPWCTHRDTLGPGVLIIFRVAVPLGSC